MEMNNTVEPNEVELREGEHEIVDRIGRDHTDYCVFAVLQNRHPEAEMEYKERSGIFKVNDREVEIEWEDPEKFEEFDLVGLYVEGIERLLESEDIL